MKNRSYDLEEEVIAYFTGNSSSLPEKVYQYIHNKTFQAVANSTRFLKAKDKDFLTEWTEDITQDMAVKLWQKKDEIAAKIREGKLNVHKIEKYIYTACLNACRNKIDSEKRRAIRDGKYHKVLKTYSQETDIEDEAGYVIVKVA